MPELFSPGYFYQNQLREAGFRSVGENVRIAKNCTIIGVENISIGDNVIIDGYCTIVAVGTGWLRLGSHIHIGSYSHLSAGDGIEMQDFSGLSQGVRIYSRTDDYSGNSLTNPTIPPNYSKIIRGTVTLEKHVIIGSGTVVLPKVTLAEGAAVGAQSLVTKNLKPWEIYFGSPVKRLKSRSRDLLANEAMLREEINGSASAA